MHADLTAALELSAALARLQRSDERYADLFRDLHAAMRQLRKERADEEGCDCDLRADAERTFR